jgi:hypothetical protein
VWYETGRLVFRGKAFIVKNMTNDIPQTQERPWIENLSDFVYGASKDNPLHVEVAVKADGRIVVFHDKPFKNEVSWFEYDVTTSKFDFIMDDGESRDFGMPLDRSVGKHMHNSHQILMVLLDDQTGEAKEGNYIPLIIHQS